MIVNSLRLTCKLKRKGKNCLNPTKVPKLQREAAQKTKTTQNWPWNGPKHHSKQYHNSTIIAHGQNPSLIQDHMSQNTDEFATMPYNSKKNSKTIMDVIHLRNSSN